MSPRSIRRAAEHKARKLAVKQSRLESAASHADDPRVTPEAPLTDPTSGRTNLSTGPRTPEGKAISSMNALRTGLTGRTVLLPSDDADAYAAHIEQYRAEYQPTGLRETELVQSLADTSWRLRRIPGLEMAIYALGRSEFADAFHEHDSSLRPAMIELRTHLKYEKVLRNLQLQESRLNRRYTAEMKELRDLQKECASRKADAQLTAPLPAQFEFSLAPNAPTSPTQFEFSTAFVAAPAADIHLAPQSGHNPLQSIDCML